MEWNVKFAQGFKLPETKWDTLFEGIDTAFQFSYSVLKWLFVCVWIALAISIIF